MKKTSIMPYPIKTFKISRAIAQKTPKIMSATKSQSATTAKRLEVEQGRFGKRGSRVRSSKFQ